MNEEYSTQLNKVEQSMYAHISSYGNLFVNGLYQKGIIKDVSPEQLQKYFANPDFYQDVLYDISNYFYVINAEIHQLFDAIEALPSLNYTISVFDREGNEDKNVKKLKKSLHSINHKRLTRDILKQTAAYGNVLGVWLGKGQDVYPYIFDDLKYVKCGYRTVKGKWQIILNARFFYDKNVFEQESLITEFRTFMNKDDYQLLLDGELISFKLPIERTIFTGTGKLNHNQFNGTGWTTPVLLDVLHKRKLKDVEQTIANKIINAVAVLTMGSFDGKEKDNQGNLVRDYNNIPEKLIRSIHESVKSALAGNDTEGMAMVTLPNFAEIAFPKIDSDGLDGDKFSQTNSDITKGIGLSSAVLNGEGANYNSAKLNLEIFYSKLGVMLEDIEYIYQLMFNLVLPKQYSDNYYMTYSKDSPLSAKDRLQHLKGLYDKGWSARTYIEELGYDFDVLYQETQEELRIGLNSSLIPPPTSYTTSGTAIIEAQGRPPTDDSEASDNTIRTRETQGN